MTRRRLAGPRTLAPLLHDRLTTAWSGSGWTRTLLLRRIAAGLLVGLAAVLALSPQAGSKADVVVAVRDLAPGVALDATSVALRALPQEAVPDGAKRSVDGVTGRLLAAPLRRGEPITDVRLAGPELARSTTGAPDAVGVPLRLSDPDVAALLHPGATVDVVTLGERQQEPLMLASGATVLAVLDTGRSVADEGGLVLVALPPQAATRVAGASLSQPVTVTVR
jgi:pilus assembly protein CpaB